MKAALLKKFKAMPDLSPHMLSDIFEVTKLEQQYLSDLKTKATQV